MSKKFRMIVYPNQEDSPGRITIQQRNSFLGIFVGEWRGFGHFDVYSYTNGIDEEPGKVPITLSHDEVDLSKPNNLR